MYGHACIEKLDSLRQQKKSFLTRRHELIEIIADHAEFYVQYFRNMSTHYKGMRNGDEVEAELAKSVQKVYQKMDVQLKIIHESTKMTEMLERFKVRELFLHLYEGIIDGYMGFQAFLRDKQLDVDKCVLPARIEHRLSVYPKQNLLPPTVESILLRLNNQVYRMIDIIAAKLLRCKMYYCDHASFETLRAQAEQGMADIGREWSKVTFSNLRRSRIAHSYKPPMNYLAFRSETSRKPLKFDDALANIIKLLEEGTNWQVKLIEWDLQTFLRIDSYFMLNSINSRQAHWQFPVDLLEQEDNRK